VTSKPNRFELSSWILVVLSMNALYLYGALVTRDGLFGINALRGINRTAYFICALSALGAALAIGAWNPRLSVERRAIAAAAGLCSWPVFFLLRTNLLNQDGNMLTPKFEADVPRLGAFLTHDELLEFFVHSKVWYYTHEWWGWSVVFSYQVVSCLAGAGFIYVLIRLTRRLAPNRAWLFLAGALSGGYMQLFFGDAENYTLTTTLVVCYVLAACRFLAGETRVWFPTVLLAIAMCFHLEAGWMLPSLLYLFAVSRARQSDWRDVRLSMASGTAIVAATVVYFHFHGLPLRRFFSSHAGHALRMSGVFAVGMPFSYYIDQLNLLLLLCPSVAILLPLLAWRRREMDDVGTFLAVAAGSMLLFQVVWKSQIGVFDDWNLYAIGGMLTTVYIWRSLAAVATTAGTRLAAAALAVTGALHTYAWIIANHRYGG
jgi:hypothetical protein